MQALTRPVRFCISTMIAALFLVFSASARADGCASDISDDAFDAAMRAYWPDDRHIPTGQYVLGPGKQLAQARADQMMNPWALTSIGGAVEAGWATASLDGSAIAAAGAGQAFARAIEDGQRHSFALALTDVGREIARKAGAPADNQSLYPKLGAADHFAVIENNLVEIGARKLRVVDTSFGLIDRPPNLEIYVRGQLAVAAALAGRPIDAANTTDSDKKQARILLLLDTHCRWRAFSADVADAGKPYTTHRIDKALACLRADPAAALKSCVSAD
jgi:hypothetical protein